jgi:transglutaminase-like putative cysteine protease
MKTNNLDSRWDWPSAALLIAAVFTVAVRLDTTNWTPDLGYVESLAVLGTILGLALGLSQFKAPAMRWLVGLYSIFFVPFHLSRIITGEKTALGQLASLGGRLSASINFLMNGKAIEDHIFFVTIMAILFWAIGIYSGYKLIRSRAILTVLLPSSVPILVIQYYDGYVPERIWGMAFYFFLALMLAGRINLLNSREGWITKRVVAGSDLEFDLNKNIASAAAIIILAAWMLPAPAAVLPAAANAWQNFNEPFENVRKRLDDMLAALNSSRVNNSTGEMYGDVMGLGRTAGTGAAELFNVRAPNNNLPRLYWRMRAYDTYKNGVWQTVNSQNTPFEPNNGNFVHTDFLPDPVAVFTFTWQTSQSAMLVTPSLPVWVSRKGSVQTTLGLGGDTDPLSWNVTPNLRVGDQYQVRALLTNPSQKELRESGNDYPVWITEHYLQLPENISEDYKRLALQITSEKPTTFDKAEAVTEYLRQNITYNETIPAPPEGTDPLDWFLFGYKSGYCNYYASAEVMLLRSVGIPARMVVGFAQGKIGDTGIYSVRGQDAHAWPEVYFPAIGWVQFEPTVNQTILVRPSGETAAPGNSSNAGGDFAGGRNNPRVDQEKDDLAAGAAQPLTARFLGLTGNQWLWISIIGLLVVVGGIFTWRFRHPALPGKLSFSQQAPRALKAVFGFYNLKSPPWLERWMLWSEASPVERAFHAVNQALTWLDKPQPNYVTPAERSLLLKKVLPEASEMIDVLSNALENALYSSHPYDAAGADRAGWNLRYLAARKLIRRWLYGE